MVLGNFTVVLGTTGEMGEGEGEVEGEVEVRELWE